MELAVRLYQLSNIPLLFLGYVLLINLLLFLLMGMDKRAAKRKK